MLFNFEIIDDHIVFLAGDKKVLLDTGAPNSIGNNRDFVFGNLTRYISENYMGFTVSQLSSLIGTEIDILMGSDIIKEYELTIDWLKCTISFSDSNSNVSNNFISISNFMNIPILSFNIGNRSYRAFFDTGAKVSYMNSEIIENYEKIGTANDFYPGFGEFETNLFKGEISIGDLNGEITFGNLPMLLEMSLMMANTQGIIGNELCKKFKVILDISQNKISLEKYN
jgi:hypothetical protein